VSRKLDAARRPRQLGELEQVGVCDRIKVFDAYRVRLLALPAAITAASPARREELCRIVIEQVVVNDRQVEAIAWTPPARPFFAEVSHKGQRECPQGALGTRPLLTDDILAWYAV